MSATPYTQLVSLPDHTDYLFIYYMLLFCLDGASFLGTLVFDKHLRNDHANDNSFILDITRGFIHASPAPMVPDRRLRRTVDPAAALGAAGPH